MSSYKDYFKGKKITILGLGLLGRGLGDTIFLAECGAILTVTDLRSEEVLAPSLEKLKGFKNIRYVFGRHEFADFENVDFVLKAAGVPLDSPYIIHTRKHNIPIEMSASLFARLAKGVTLVGVTGTRGKSTTTHLIYEILKSAGHRVFLGGNVRGVSTLALLSEVKTGDIVVLELDSWQLQGFGDNKISPHISVFTNFLDDHLLYYQGDKDRYWQDKANIFKYQTAKDILIVGESVLFKIKSAKSKSKIISVSSEFLPKSWKLKLIGGHNRENAAFAFAVAKELAVPDTLSRSVIETFNPVPGRLELLRSYKGIEIYNDNNATTPDATIVGLRALNKEGKIVLIAGGTDKGLPLDKLALEIQKSCKVLILINGSGTKKLSALSSKLKAKTVLCDTLKDCLNEAIKLANKGDVVLFSPAFSSFGKWFKNEYDRDDQFCNLVKNLK